MDTPSVRLIGNPNDGAAPVAETRETRVGRTVIGGLLLFGVLMQTARTTFAIGAILALTFQALLGASLLRSDRFAGSARVFGAVMLFFGGLLLVGGYAPNVQLYGAYSAAIGGSCLLLLVKRLSRARLLVGSLLALAWLVLALVNPAQPESLRASESRVAPAS